MATFIELLDRIDYLKKQKQYDGAWLEANAGLLQLKKSRSQDWHLMYYQMADILAREKKWLNALEKMGLCVHYLGGLGGNDHSNFVVRLLKKVGHVDKFDDYLRLVIKTRPEKIPELLRDFLGQK